MAKYCFHLFPCHPSSPLLILTDYPHASCLKQYISERGKKRVDKSKHRDLIWQALTLLSQRTAPTNLAWVKSHTGILPRQRNCSQPGESSMLTPLLSR